MKNVYLLIGLFSAIAGAGCHSNSNKSQNNYPAYADYRISGAEDQENVTAIFQFKPDSASTQSIMLDAPAQVTLDEEIITADSANFTGVYYEIQKPLKTFTGSHTVIFTDASGKAYRQVFNFTPFHLETIIPATVKRQDITLHITGLKPVDVLRLVVIDTSFTTADINMVDTITNGVLTISRRQWSNLAPGPVTLQLFKEEEQTLNNAASKGGHLSITYRLSQDFDLED